MLKITGTINVFVRENKGYKFFSTSISLGKDKDGNYIDGSAYLDVRFTNEAVSKENQKKLDVDHYYVFEVTNAFLSAKKYLGKDGNMLTSFEMIVSECKLKAKQSLKGAKKPAKKVEKAPNYDDLPF